MTLEQYGDYFYLYILIISLIPAIILGILEKPIKYYGLFLSIIMIPLLMSHNFNEVYHMFAQGDIKGALKSGQMEFILFLIFLFVEISVIKIYLEIRKKTDNKYVYYIFLILSILPVFIAKITSITPLGAVGFLGLSYLNFKVIQMIIEIHDGALKEISIIKTLYFIIFFPTLSSGPIDRYRRFDSDLNKRIERKEYINDYLIKGIEYIFRGILYKFIISALISVWMDAIPKDISWYHGIKYMYSYSLYLFFDFAGYSAFAIGTSYILGIKTPINFNKPFLSKDMKEFWTRWHISLSRWFGDYIFSRFVINSMRKKIFKSRFTASHVAQILTMFIMGIWHGFEVYYIIYGLYQGIVLVLTDIFQRKSKFYKAHKKEKWFQCVEIIVTFNIACFGLLIFSGYGFKK
ncbi:MAG TPA: D-alanyl-lipoteichoic acid biosynthesis protein DltB [Clostridium sp.]|nr:D-alanyl-lipoteichoic acid biosynthesis protein DltB [Clostridium sp.]